jgi:hypothetical protein
MIGSLLFAAGSIMVLNGFPNSTANGIVFFAGSVFFTVASYMQFHQAINAAESLDESGNTAGQTRRLFAWHPRRIDFWATFPQFVGTLAFNISTFAAIATVGWLGYEVKVWAPDYFGCILFVISGLAAVLEYCSHFWCWQWRSISWWVVWSSFVGCLAFLAAAILAFVAPFSALAALTQWSTILTLWGAICFFVGAWFMWPEMASETPAAA